MQILNHVVTSWWVHHILQHLWSNMNQKIKDFSNNDFISVNKSDKKKGNNEDVKQTKCFISSFRLLRALRQLWCFPHALHWWWSQEHLRALQSVSAPTESCRLMKEKKNGTSHWRSGGVSLWKYKGCFSAESTERKPGSTSPSTRRKTLKWWSIAQRASESRRNAGQVRVRVRHSQKVQHADRCRDWAPVWG